jgi:hypothetical protein
MARRKALKPRFTEETIYQLDCLLDFVSAQDLREYLLEIYHTYIVRENEMLPENFSRIAESLQILFEFLKLLEQDEMQRNSKPSKR